MNVNRPPEVAHKATCYDDDGQLECCCELRPLVEAEQAEQISRAEAERLVNDYSLKATAQVLDTIMPVINR